MKRILKKGLASILIVLLLVNFVATAPSYALDLNDFLSGLIGVVTWIPRAMIMAALFGVRKLVTDFAEFGLEGIERLWSG